MPQRFDVLFGKINRELLFIFSVHFPKNNMTLNRHQFKTIRNFIKNLLAD